MLESLFLSDPQVVLLFLPKHILDALLMVYVLRQFFSYRLKNFWSRAGLVLLVAVCLTGLYVLGQALWVIPGVLLLSALLCQWVFAGDRKQILSMSILLSSLRILLEFLPFGLFALLWRQPPHLIGEQFLERILLVTCSVGLSYLAGFLLVRWKQRAHQSMERYLSSNLIYTIIPLVNVFVLSYILYLDAQVLDPPWQLALLFFLLTIAIISSTFVTFFAHATDHQRVHLAYRLQEEALRFRHAQELYDIQQQNLTQIRKITHDFNNHLTVFSKLTTAESSVEEYRNDLQRDLDHVRSLLPQGIQNETLHVILYHYQDTCKTHDIALQLDIRYDDFAFISCYDLSGILFNALDNAVHAASRSEDCSISFLIKQTASMVLLSIENSCSTDDAPATSEHPDLYAAHGYGCGNIRDLVEKNGGQLTVRKQEGSYQLMILFPIKPSSPEKRPAKR